MISTLPQWSHDFMITWPSPVWSLELHMAWSHDLHCMVTWSSHVMVTWPSHVMVTWPSHVMVTWPSLHGHLTFTCHGHMTFTAWSPDLHMSWSHDLHMSWSPDLHMSWSHDMPPHSYGKEISFHLETIEDSSSSDILLLEHSQSPRDGDGEEHRRVGTRQHSKNQSLVLALAKTFKLMLLRSFVFKLCNDLLAFTSPLILKWVFCANVSLSLLIRTWTIFKGHDQLHLRCHTAAPMEGILLRCDAVSGGCGPVPVPPSVLSELHNSWHENKDNPDWSSVQEGGHYLKGAQLDYAG